MLAPSSLASPPPSSADTERPTLSPAPWVRNMNPETMEHFKQYSSNMIERDPEYMSQENQNSIPLEAVVSKKPVTPNDSQVSNIHNMMPGRWSTSTSVKRTSRSSCSSRASSSYDMGDEVDNDLSRKHTHRAPPRPGPPPARCLPALPESRDTNSTGNAGWESTYQNPTRPVSESRLPALESHTTSLEPHQSVGTLSSRKILNNSVTETHYVKSADTPQPLTREEKVKARKARDMEKARLRRQAAAQQEAMNALTAKGSKVIITPVVGEEVRPKTPPTPEEMGPFPMARGQRLSRMRKTMSGDTSTPPTSPNPAAADLMQRVPSPPPLPQMITTLASPTTVCSSSGSFYSNRSLEGNEEEMELRIQAVERKNRMLEKALIAVIRGTVRNDQRAPALQRVNYLQDLLEQLQTIDTNAYVPEEGAVRI